MSYFDPDGTFAHKMSDIESDNQFASIIKQLGFSIDKKVFHYYQSGCACHLLGTLHRKSVEDLAVAYGYENVFVDLSLYPELSGFVPSVPSVSVFNANQQLAFIGPYSSGLFCGAGKGLVEGFIKSSFLYYGSVVVSDASGCYCKVRKDS